MNSEKKYISKPCTICGIETEFCCADCGINSGGEQIPHVCNKVECRNNHEKLERFHLWNN